VFRQVFSSRHHSPIVKPRFAAAVSNSAYSSSVSFVPADRVRALFGGAMFNLRRLLAVSQPFQWLPESTDIGTAQHPKRGDVSPPKPAAAGGFCPPIPVPAGNCFKTISDEMRIWQADGFQVLGESSAIRVSRLAADTADTVAP
jgi:hypothetical protein